VLRCGALQRLRDAQRTSTPAAAAVPLPPVVQRALRREAPARGVRPAGAARVSEFSQSAGRTHRDMAPPHTRREPHAVSQSACIPTPMLSPAEGRRSAEPPPAASCAEFACSGWQGAPRPPTASIFSRCMWPPRLRLPACLPSCFTRNMGAALSCAAVAARPPQPPRDRIRPASNRSQLSQQPDPCLPLALHHAKLPGDATLPLNCSLHPSARDGGGTPLRCVPCSPLLCASVLCAANHIGGVGPVARREGTAPRPRPHRR
jgi:hypothetical protein